MSDEKQNAPNPEKQVFYSHVPSSGGTTLWSILKEVYGKQHVERTVSGPGTFETFMLKPFPNRAYRSWAVMGGHVPVHIASKRFPDRHILTIVRDPVDQLVSRYRRLVRTSKWTVKGEMSEADLGQFLTVYAATNELSRYLDPTKKGNASLDQIEDFWSASSRTVGLTESYEETLMLFAHDLGWQRAPDYERRNIGPDDGFELTPEGRARIADLLGRDYLIYERARGIFESRIQAISGEAFNEGLEDLRARTTARQAAATTTYTGKPRSAGSRKKPRSLPIKRFLVKLLFGNVRR